MAGEKVVGKINEIQGGDVLIIRASGERVVAKAGDLILEGDTVASSASASVTISVATGGEVSISGGNQATFDAVLFDQVASLLPSSSEQEPVAIGTKASPNTLNTLNEAPGTGSNTSPEEQDRVNDPIPDFNPNQGRNENLEEKLPGTNSFNLDDTKKPSVPFDSPDETPVANTNEESEQESDTSDTQFIGTETPPEVTPPQTSENTPQEPTEDSPVVTAPPVPSGPSGPSITIPNDNSVGANNDDITVSEDATTPITGTFTVSAADGVDSLQIGGTTLTLAQLNAASSVVPVEITSASFGSLDIIDFNETTGVVTYEYTPEGSGGPGSAQDHSTAANATLSDNIALVLTTAATTPEVINATLNIGVTDTMPVANDDARSISEGTSAIAGNAFGIAGAAIGDVQDGTLLDANSTPVTAANITGNYGSMTINNVGVYTYTLDNTSTDVQGLKDGQSLADVFTYTVTDGDGSTDTANITVTVNGVDDAPVIAGTFTGSVTEGNVGDSPVTASGALTITDADTDDTPSFANVTSVVGDNGFGSFSLNNGTWTYTLDQNAVQDLDAGDIVNDTTTFTSSLGSTQQITTTITGTGDVAIISGTSTGSVTEGNVGDAPVTASGTLTISDADANDAPSFADVTSTTGDSGYGSFVLVSSTWTYTLDQNEVISLDAGDSVNDTTTFTATDGSTQVVTTTINGVADALPTITVEDADAGTTALDNSTVEAFGSTITGTATITATAGVSALTVGGQDVTNATTSNVTVTGSEGSLVVTGFNDATGVINYSYTEDGNNEAHNAADDNISDSFSIAITDFEGDSATDTLDILITDTAPTAAADNASITEDTAPNTVTGDVTTNDTTGSDTAISVSGVDFGGAQTVGTTFSSDHGTLDLNSDGTYTYTLDNGDSAVNALNSGQSLVETFTYTISDTDGDTSTSTLSVTVNGADEPPTITIPDANGVAAGDISVAENATLTDSFTVTSTAGLMPTGTALSIEVDFSTTNLTLAQLNALSSTNQVISAGDGGDITLTAYNSSTGEISYTFDPTGINQDHSGGDILENYSITATDFNGNTTDVLDINITDTNPVANGDARSISEGTSAIAGNAVGFAGAATGDVQDTIIDTVTVTDIDFGGTDGIVGTNLLGDHGTVNINSAGVYTYTLDNTSSDVQGLKNGQSLTDVFTYTITDSDGDTDTANLTVTIDGVDDPPPTVVAPANSVADGSGNTVAGELSVVASAGVSTVTLAGSGTAQDVSGATTASASSHVTLTGADGNLVVTNFNTSTGVVTYNYIENGSNDNPLGTDNFSIVAIDNEGDSSSGSLSITLNDIGLVIPNDDSLGANNDDVLIAENASTAHIGTFTLVTPNSFGSLQIGSTIFNEAQLNTASTTALDVTDENNGTLQVTDYNSGTGVVTYSYDPTGTSQDHTGATNDILEESLTVVFTDSAAVSTTESLDIGITDTNPVANDDARSITEGTSAIAGNVVGIAGAASGDVQDTIIDPVTVTDIDFGGTNGTVGTGLVGDHGTVLINSVGVYTYILDNTSSDVQGLKNGESLTDVFTYTITDSDGDTDTANLTVTINGLDDPLPTVNVVDNNAAATGENSVVEATGNTLMGTANITASAGVATLTVAGQDVTSASSTNVTVTGSEGTLVVTAFNPGSGLINYNYTEDGNSENHSAGEILDNFAIVVTDNEGDSATDTLDILITDTAPTATADTASITEDAAPNTVTGNVVSNDSTGSDTAISVVGVNFGGAQTVGSSFSSDHGTLDLNSDGTYTYTLDNGDSAVNALNSGQSLVETFNYTISDTDGDTSSSTLTVTINGVDQAVVSSTAASGAATDNEALTGTSADEDFVVNDVLSATDGATVTEVVDGNGGSDRLIIDGDDIPMVAANGDNEGGGFQQIELQDFTFVNTANNAERDVIDISDLLDTAGADANMDNTITVAEATPFIHISEADTGTNGGIISIDVGGGFDNADRTAINAGSTTDVGTGDRDLVISSNEASADLDTAASEGGYTGTAYSPVEADQTAQIQALVDQNVLVIDA